MDKKQYERIKTLASKEQFTDLKYANQLIETLCQELESKIETLEHLQNQFKNRPVTFPHHCFLLFSKDRSEEFYLFRQNFEAELFRLSLKNANNYYIRTIELFENHKKALLKKEYGFLKKPNNVS